MYRLLFYCVVMFCAAACSLNNAKEDNSIERYFKEKNVTGTFGLFDNGTGEFTIYNMKRFSDSALPAYQTKDIIYSLVGIETGNINDSAQLVSLTTLENRIGNDTLSYWLDTLGYNPMKITADEQLGLVKKLYFGQLPFQARSQRIVKNTLKKEDNANYILSYKTGSGVNENNVNVAWLSGWIEENRHPYFFVLQIEGVKASDEVSLAILKDILRQYDFMEGKR